MKKLLIITCLSIFATSVYAQDAKVKTTDQEVKAKGDDDKAKAKKDEIKLKDADGDKEKDKKDEVKGKSGNDKAKVKKDEAKLKEGGDKAKIKKDESKAKVGDDKEKIKKDEDKTKIGDDKAKIKKDEMKYKDDAGKTKFSTKMEPGFSRSTRGLQYKIARDIPGGRKPTVGDFLEMHIHMHVGDSVLFDTRKMNNNQPVSFQLQAPAFNSDPSEGFTMMTVGDSAVFRVPVDSLEKAGAKMMPWMKSGQMIEYNVTLVSVKTQQEVAVEKEKQSMQQKGKDDMLLENYISQNKIRANKTASGLYYKIDNPGSGDNIKAGQTVTVNYTGKTIDGNTFDSNVDPKFNHVQPFSFAVGQNQVIKGWDEGLQLLKKGGKGTFYIPSTLAYGANSPGPGIPANSILIFDVEVTDVK